MPRRVFLPVLVLSLLGARASAGAPPDETFGRDYQIGNPGWNGLSDFAALARGLGCPVEARQALDWEALEGQDILFFLYPESAPAEHHVLAFLSAAGRLVLADDFGQGGPALRALGITLRAGADAANGANARRYRDNPALPIAVPLRATSLGRAAMELVANHPAVFESALQPTYAFGPGHGEGLVIEGALAGGRFVAIADPSLFINNMLQLAGNRDFAARLVLDLCRPQKDRLLLFHGPFSQRGTPRPVLAGTPPRTLGRGESRGDFAETAERWNRALAGANLHIQETLQRKDLSGRMDVALLIGLLLTFAALLLVLRYLPLSAAPHDASFAQAPAGSSAGGAPQLGLFASVQRYSRRGVPWGYIYPAALIREEVLLRLSPHLSALPRFGDLDTVRPAQVEALIAERVGAAAGRAAAALWREFRSIPGKSTVQGGERMAGLFLSERRMARLYRLAATLFAELQRR